MVITGFNIKSSRKAFNSIVKDWVAILNIYSLFYLARFFCQGKLKWYQLNLKEKFNLKSLNLSPVQFERQ